MLLQHKSSGSLVEIKAVEELVNPLQEEVTGQFQAGQEEQDPEPFTKSHLIFPSGETLPRCWSDPNYRSGESKVS